MPLHKTPYRSASLLLLILALLVLPEAGLAQVAGGNATMPTGLEATIATLVSKAIGFINILIWVMFIFLNFVLDPQFIFDLDSGRFMDMLNRIWQLSRDLMNVCFALVLIGTAVYTIVTANKDFVSAHAKKFLMAVILVNFSWFFPRVILDVANVATSTIYGIPSLLFDESGANSCTYKTSKKTDAACTEYTEAEPGVATVYDCPCRVVVNADMFMSADEALALEGAGWECTGTILCVQTEPWNPRLIAGHSAILNGLILNHAHLGTLANVPAPVNDDDIGQMTRFLLVEGIIVVIHIALLFPLLAMFVAFLVRIPILWLTMAFMPFVFLSWVIENEYADETKEIWKQFLKAAFLPAAIAIPLSVGFILVNAGAQLTAGPIASIKIRLIDGISNYWQLLWWVMTLGVLWVGTFMVFEKAGGFYNKAATSIKGYGEAWGKVALKAPLSVPLPGTSLTPLAALRMASPHTINAKMNGEEGIFGYTKFIDDTLKGKGSNNQKDTAESFANGPTAKLDTLHQDLVNLEKDLRDGKAAGKSAAEQQARVEAFRQKNNIDLSGDHAQKLDDFVKNLKQANPKLNTADPNRNFDNLLQKFKTLQSPV